MAVFMLVVNAILNFIAVGANAQDEERHEVSGFWFIVGLLNIWAIYVMLG
jgi:hypothetical protein